MSYDGPVFHCKKHGDYPAPEVVCPSCQEADDPTIVAERIAKITAAVDAVGADDDRCDALAAQIKARLPYADLDAADEDEDADSLLPCPFCGGAGEYGEVAIEEGPDFGGEYIQCAGCKACTALMFPLKEDVKALLRERWNTRTALEAEAAASAAKETKG